MLRRITNYLLVFFILTVWFIFASPYFLKGKVPYSSTYQVNHFAPWSTYEKFWGPVKNGAMPDVTSQIYPWRHLVIEIWKSGQIPLWNPYSFSGTPLLANYQPAAFSPFNLLFFILPFIDAWSILVLLQPLLAGIFMYLFVRTLKISNVGSLISSLSFMFCGFITVWMGYGTLGYAILFLPLALFCIEKYYKTKRNIFLAVFSLTFPLSFFSGHFQISTYFFLFIFAYILYKFFSTRNILNTLYLILYTFFGLLLSMPQILPSIELYGQSFRSSFFQTGFIPLQYIPTILAPDFFGNPVTRNTWFGHYAEWNAYIGVLPLMLTIYTISRIKKTQLFFLFIFAVFTLILATNNPISNFILSLKIPILSTSGINRIISLYSFAFVVLAGFGYDHLLLDIKGAKKKRILFWIGLFGLVFIVLWGLIILKLFIPVDKIIISKQNLILPTFLFLTSGINIIFAILITKNKYSCLFLRFLPFVLLFLVAFDMLRFAKKWQAFDPKNLVFAEVPTTTAFSKIAGFNRILGNFGAEASVYYHLPSVEGYDALYIKRYGEFAGFLENGKILESAWSVVSFPKDGLHTRKAVNLLNIGYIVHKLRDDHAGWTFPFWTYPKDQFKLIYKDAEYEFYKNTKAFPHAFLVGKYRVINDAQKILNIMFSKDFNLREEIILEQDPGIEKTEGYIGTVNIESFSPNRVEMMVETRNQGLLFMSDNYYKGWKAEVDGVNTPIYRANYTFRAVPVTSGKHSVKFTYDPDSFKLGVFLGILGAISVLTTFLIPRFLTRLVSILSLQSEKDRRSQVYL